MYRIYYATGLEGLLVLTWSILALGLYYIEGNIGRGIRWCNIDLSCSRCIRGDNTDPAWQLMNGSKVCGNSLEAMDVRMCRKTKTCIFYSEYKYCMYA